MLISIKQVKTAPQDELLEVKLSNGSQKIFIATEKGKAVYFNEELVSVMGRNTSGVKAIKLAKDDKTVGIEIVDPEGLILTITTKGYGKRTNIQNYRLSGRNVKGIINVKLSEKIGKVIDIEHLIANEELLIISASGKIIRIETDKIPILNRGSRGVKLMSLEVDDYITAVAKISLTEEE